MKRVAAVLALAAFVGAFLAARHALRSQPVEETSAATATVLHTQVTPNGNRVDIRGTGATTTDIVWTPRDVYLIEGQTIAVVYDRKGGVSWDDPKGGGVVTTYYLFLCIFFLGVFSWTAMLAFGLR